MSIKIGAEQRLSHSVLWKLQEEAYCQFGLRAWTEKKVPFYITSNPFIAKRYANIVLGYIRDLLMNGSLNEEEPLYFFDLGAGTGRFSYLFLNTILRFLKSLNLKLKICYIMTDIAWKNIAFWQEHSSLQHFIKEGILDFAFYSHQFEEEKIVLIQRQLELSPESIQNPLIILANYFFDTIPQDLFRTKRGRLEEGKIHLFTEDTSSPRDPSIINHLKYNFTYSPLDVHQEYYSGFPEANQLLKLYSELLAETSFLFPIGALQTIRYFSRLSGNRLLWICGDQGYCTEEQVRSAGEPRISLHGSFSISVSYYALSLFFNSVEGQVFLARDMEPMFAIMAATLGLNNSAETANAFHENIEVFSPTDYWILGQEATFTLDQMLKFLKLGEGDPVSMHSFFPLIRKELPQATQWQKNELVRAIENVWDHFYPVGEEEADFILDLGVLLFEMEHYEKALSFFEHSIQLKPENPLARKNALICLEKMKQVKK